MSLVDFDGRKEERGEFGDLEVVSFPFTFIRLHCSGLPAGTFNRSVSIPLLYSAVFRGSWECERGEITGPRWRLNEAGERRGQLGGVVKRL